MSEVQRCHDCASRIGPWTDSTIYDPALRRAFSGYCPRCYRKAIVLDMRTDQR